MPRITGKFEETESPAPQQQTCCLADNTCGFDNHRREATVRVNDYFICNSHYERGFDRQLRQGEEVPKHEQVIQSRIFHR